MAEHELNKIVDDDGEVFNLRDSTKQPTADRVTAWGSTPSDTKYPSEKLVKTSLDAKANDTSVVHIENEETINGEKKFKGGVKISNSDGDCYGIFMLPSAGSGPNYSTWDSSLQDGEHFREWTLCFPTGANFWGRIRISFLGGFNSFNASGSISKTILCAFNTQNVYNNTGSYDALGINTENEFRISDLIWDDTNARWTIKIHSIKPTSNNRITAIRIEYYCRYDYVSVIRNLTWVSTSPSIVTDTTYYTKRSGNASTSPRTGGEEFNWADKPVFQSPYGKEIFDRSHTIPIGNGGTGGTTQKAAEYNICNPDELSSTPSDNSYVVFSRVDTASTTNGRFQRIKLSYVWEYIKGKISSVLGLSESNGVKTFTGNAATASAAQSGSALETAINGKMNTSASNATAPSGSGGDGATATLLNNLTEGNSDIVTTDDGDNVLIATTDNGGSVTNKWYKRKLVKLIPWIIKKLGTGLVYDCGAGSTSGDDFDAALAAFNAGQWVIIRKDGIAYYSVGSYSGPGLRFKQIANDGSLLKVNTISWTRGSLPSAVTQTEASLSGHTHTRSDITNFAHTHGNIQDGGALQTSDVTIASGDKLVVTDSSDSGKVARASASFDGSTTTKALTQKGTFETFMTPSASNAASGALQNLTGQLTEGTSDFTDNTEIFTSYAGDSGFAEAGHVNQPYRRKASSMLNYVRTMYAEDRSPANVGTSHKRISLGYGKYNSSAVGAATYLVHLFFNYADNGGLQGKGITVLVTYDFRKSSLQKAECRILSDNGVRDSGYNIVLANYVSGSGDNSKLYICIGLVKNSAPTTLVAFAYSYCKIFKLCTIGDWTQDISSDAVGTYEYIIQATDLVSAAVNADMVDGKHIVIGSWAGASNTIYFG